MITDVIDVKRILWDPNVEALVERANPRCGVKAIEKHVKSGLLNVYEIICEDKRLAILITRIDTLLDGSQELVIMHAVGDFKTSQNLVGILNPTFDALAKVNKVRAIRVHTERKGMDALLGENGYNFIENVYRKEIN